MVNVIIPIYKAKATLPKALDSLVAQTKTMFWVTLVQDGDEENYEEIVSEYQRRGLNISLIKLETNGGPGVARQAGVDHSDMFEYVMFLDADDMLTPRAIEILYSEIAKNHADIISSNFILEEQHNPGYIMDINRAPITWCHGKIYRRKYLVDNDIRFLNSLRANEDAYFNLVAFHCSEKTMKIPEVTYIWRDNKNSITRNNLSDFMDNYGQDYILGQILAIKKIFKIAGEMKPQSLGATIQNVYYAMMRQEYFKLNHDLYINELLSLKKEPLIQDFLNDGNNWLDILMDVKAAAEYDGIVYFYKDRFVDWIKKYIAEDVDE